MVDMPQDFPNMSDHSMLLVGDTVDISMDPSNMENNILIGKCIDYEEQ